MSHSRSDNPGTDLLCMKNRNNKYEEVKVSKHMWSPQLKGQLS